jgi:hypothetical protein
MILKSIKNCQYLIVYYLVSSESGGNKSNRDTFSTFLGPFGGDLLLLIINLLEDSEKRMTKTR